MTQQFCSSFSLSFPHLCASLSFYFPNSSYLYSLLLSSPFFSSPFSPLPSQNCLDDPAEVWDHVWRGDCAATSDHPVLPKWPFWTGEEGGRKEGGLRWEGGRKEGGK